MRINGDGQEVLYLAEGDNVRLGCPYILDPEDYGPNGLDIEWMQVNSDPSHRENVVSAGCRALLTLYFVMSTCWAANILRGEGEKFRKPRPCTSPKAFREWLIRTVHLGIKVARQAPSSHPIPKER